MSSRIYRLRTGEEIRWPKNHRGFVLAYAGRDEFRQRCYEIRKPTPEQRCAIVFAYVRSHEDEYIKVSFLAGRLGVTERTIQSDIRTLENLYKPSNKKLPKNRTIKIMANRNKNTI